MAKAKGMGSVFDSLLLSLSCRIKASPALWYGLVTRKKTSRAAWLLGFWLAEGIE